MGRISWSNLKRMIMEKRWLLIVLIVTGLLILLVTIFPIARQSWGNYLIQLGEQYLSESKYEEAVIQFNKAIQIVPKKIGGYDGGFRAYMALEHVPAATQILVKASDNLERQDFRGLLKRCLSDSLSNTWRQIITDGLLDSGVPQEDLPEENPSESVTEKPKQPDQETTNQETKLPSCFTWRVEPTLEFDDIQPINEIGSRVEKDGKYGIIDYDGNLIWDIIYGQITVDDVSTGLVYMDSTIVDGRFEPLSGKEEKPFKGDSKSRMRYYVWDLDNQQLLPIDSSVEEANNKYQGSFGGSYEFYLPTGYPFTGGFVEGVHTKKNSAGKTEIVSHTGTYAFYDANINKGKLLTDFSYKDYFTDTDMSHDQDQYFTVQDLEGNWNYIIISNDGKVTNQWTTDVCYTDPKQLVFQSDIDCMVNTEGFQPYPYQFTNNRLYYEGGQWKYRFYEVNLYMQNDTLKEPDPNSSLYNFISAPATIDGKWGYIQEDGKQMIPGLFEEARPFYGGKAWVKVNGKWGVIQLTCPPEKLQ